MLLLTLNHATPPSARHCPCPAHTATPISHSVFSLSFPPRLPPSASRPYSTAASILRLALSSMLYSY